jgi:hypothetical protein
LLSGHAFYRMMNMRDEYLIHKTHRTFRAWLLPFALLADNLKLMQLAVYFYYFFNFTSLPLLKV